LEKVWDRDVAAIAFCEKEGLVVFYRPGMAGGVDKIGTINVNEPVSLLPAYMNIYQPFAKLESEIGPPDKRVQNRSFETLSYEMKDGLKVNFDVLPNGGIGHITFVYPDS
jgi:hypothetical protein